MSGHLAHDYTGDQCRSSTRDDAETKASFCAHQQSGGRKPTNIYDRSGKRCRNANAIKRSTDEI